MVQIYFIQMVVILLVIFYNLIYYYCDNSIITYIGYKLIHPLKKDMLLTIGLICEF